LKSRINKEAKNSEEYFKELKKRSRSFVNGKAKTYSWEETKQAAIKRLEAKKQSV
jgi:hypothetical protein